MTMANRNSKGRRLSLLLLATAFVGLVALASGATAEDTIDTSNNNNNNLIHDDTSVLSASEILLKVYDETRGLRWNDHTNWLQSNDVCSWYGVTCYDAATASDQRRVGHVQKLDLSSNSLLGTLPSIVFELPYVETIDLKDNADLTVVFTGIEKAQYLKELAISDTHTTSLEGIQAARQLQTLHMTNLGLTGPIPSGLFQLTNLVGLFANYNKFSSSIPTQIGNLRFLAELYLFNSDLTGQIPSEIGRCAQLQVLTLAENALGGTLPAALSSLTHLSVLAINRDANSLKGPGISGPLPSLSQVNQITDIRLQNQMLTGSIPDNFLQQASTQSVVKVDLTGNKLSGAVPSGLKDLKRLNLMLADNQISSVPNDLCDSIHGWMGGAVETLGCDAFLCRPGSSAPTGRATQTQACTSCDGAQYWGSTRCALSTSSSSTGSLPTTSSGITERETLVTLYHRMGGRYWRNDEGWLDPAKDICEWYGVECVSGKVTGLALKNNELTDTPPSELFSLPELKSLDFSANSIKFNFQGIGNARKLDTLMLANCDLDFLDGIEEMSSLSLLSKLDLSGNYFQGQLPIAFLKLSSLRQLDVSQNRFSGVIPQQIGGLRNLETLGLSKNKFNGQLPTVIGSLLRLRELKASENEFSGVLPKEFNSLTALESLSLHQTTSSNNIGGPLPEFRNLAKLTSLQLDSNRLTGTLPSVFLENTQQGSAKVELRLSDNQLQGQVPAAWSDRFQKLLVDLSGNMISGFEANNCGSSDWMGGNVGQYSCNGILCPPGSFNEYGRQTGPNSVCRSCADQGSVQYYGSKDCSDSANAAIKQDSELGTLEAFFDSTNGNNWKVNDGWKSSSSPCGWYGIECNVDGKVVSIELESNSLTGSVTSALFQLGSLRTLNLKGNQISFSFDGISQASNLAKLTLSGTGLDSATGISQAPGLVELHLSDNDLKGSIPDEIFKLSNLRKLSLDFNALTGKIPPTISSLKNLEELALYNNRLVGQIPASLGLLSRLTTLSLAENSFSGTLPVELNDLTSLEVLSIQREGGTDSSNIGINHGANDDYGVGISGPLLPFDKLKYIRKLYLGVNSLTGTIPFNFLDGVVNKALPLEIDLISNELTGPLPASLTQFDALSIYVAGNEIDGIAEGLCHKGQWMNGAVAQYGCDAILCRPGTFGDFGRQATSSNSGCSACDSQSSADYYGSFKCVGAEVKQSQSEQSVLESIFKATGGKNWRHNDYWLDEDEGICSWFGVTCVPGQESVQSLRLPHNGISGTMPASLWQLTNLEVIDFSQNPVDVKFSGMSPSGKLEYVNIESTNVRSIEGLESASSLKTLHIAGNSLVGFPPEVVDLSNLESLDLSRNSIGTIPSLETLQNLNSFACSSCGLMGNVPEFLGSLTKLEHLQMGENSLVGPLPAFIQSLTNLKILDLGDQSYNGSGGLQGPLLDLSNFSQLQELYLQRNQLTGSIPETFLNTVNTGSPIVVDLRFNNVTGSIPAGLTRISSLNIDLAGNKIAAIPQSICSTSWNGRDDSVSGCDFILCDKGTFNALGRQTADSKCIACPDEGYATFFGSTECGPTFEKKIVQSLFENLGGSQWKRADGWRDHDDFCSWYGVTCYEGGFRNGFVQTISLSDNNLVGAVPQEIWGLVHMKELDLSKNDVSVAFEGIGNAQSLETLQLSESKLSSMEGIWRAPSVKYMHLTNNQIQGTLPSDLFSMTQLKGLYLNFNELTGSVPSEIGRLSQLQELYIFHNNLNGTLPQETGDLFDIEILSLGENKFTGPIPFFLTMLQNLRVLALQREKSIQEHAEFFMVVEDLGLTGELLDFSNCPKLTEIYLENNHLQGEIPDTLLMFSEDTTKTVKIDLSNNMLHGTVPASLAKFDDLRINLAQNGISDVAPELCAKSSWMDGEVANGCDAILCPPGTYNTVGRRTGTEECDVCNFRGAAMFYGSTMCGALFPSGMSEAMMLEELYTATGGVAWTDSTNWPNEDIPVCQWHGVTCEVIDGEDRVTELDLSNNGLQGIVPSIVFYIPRLRKLNLGLNNVWVKFDDILYTVLEELFLDGANVVSLEGISKATDLRTLHLHHNPMGGQTIPDELFELSNLEIVNLSGCGLTGTLSTLVGRLQNLVSLLVHDNHLESTLPATIGQLSQLQDLFLTDNDFIGTLPSDLIGLVSLRGLFLDSYSRKGAGITGPLPSFATMPKLRELHLGSNSLTGAIPENLLAGVDNFSEKINVDLGSNHLVGSIPAPLSVFDKLNLDVTNNFISQISDGLCEKSQWFEGAVGAYSCAGLLCPAGSYNENGRQTSDENPCVPCAGNDVPPYLGQTSCLTDEKRKERQILELFYKTTGGDNWKKNDGWMGTDDYCTWFGIKCVDGDTTVRSIALGSNNLVGVPPKEIFELKDLAALWLYSNPIDFSFEGIGKAANLEKIRLDSTGLKSLDGIEEGSNLIEIDVRFNRLQGSLPSLEKLRQLETFSCGENKLSGPLPDFAENPRLTTLRLGSNRFSGTIPPLATHRFMKTFDVSSNQVTGTIPDNLLESADPSHSIFLDFSSNLLSGAVPNSLARFSDLTLYLRDNSIDNLEAELCSKKSWNGGDVEFFQCDGILCPPKTYSAGLGRASRGGSDCQRCDSAKYWGTISCSDHSSAPPGLLRMGAASVFAALVATALLLY